jgi:predicted HicB family RNase H-like nuclease
MGERHMPIEEKKQLVTSLRIDPEIWKQAKVEAIQHDITLTQLVEEAINCWIKSQKERKQKQS